jgi:hypothetical protein
MRVAVNDDIKFFLINRALNVIWVIEEATGWASARLYRAERALLASGEARPCGHRQSAAFRGQPCRACAQLAASNREDS